jgi:antitoxin component of RelBE/YafQ-DinJ toxin-antitoxin module
MTEKNAALNVRIEESLLHDYKNMCEERGVVMSKVIRKLLIDDLEKYQNWTAAQQQKAKKNGR